MDEDGLRGTGRTTRQMLDAPKGALYVWCNKHLDYPRALARHLGRADLVVVSPSYERRGYSSALVILDHAGVARET
jgi:hypothetical protein